VSVRGNGCGRPYGGSVSSPEDAPIFASMVSRLQQDRAAAERHAEELDRLLADVEALHEPDANGDCPTCLTEAPCVTFELLHNDRTFDAACSCVRDRERDEIDLVAIEQPDRPHVPRLDELMAIDNPALDRAFETLLGMTTPTQPRRSA
jgi:hypothetical protein